MPPQTVVTQQDFENAFSALFASEQYSTANPTSQEQQILNLLSVLGAIGDWLGQLTQQQLAQLLTSIRNFGSNPIEDLSAWFAAWWLSIFGMSPWPAAGTGE